MLISDIKRVVEQVSRDKGIDSDVLIKTLEEALRSAARKKYGSKIDIEVKYNEDLGEIEVFQFREVVEEVEDPDLEISIKDGLRMDPECEIGDSLGAKIDTGDFGRIAAQSAKQVIIQKIKDAERNAVYANFINRKGEIINGIVQRIDRNNIIVNLGQAEALLPSREQIPRESYRRGDRVRAYIMDVRNDSHGPQIILSRSHPEFLICLFKTEVPEISESIVSIMGAAREPGSRGKIAVSSNDSDIDPVGACVGMKGSRVQNVVQELKGEKIDIIPWHIDPAKFVCNALAPAEISRVIIDEDNRTMEVIVPDDFLSVAIGKRGQNVRLASKLTRWRIDVKSESRYSKTMKEGYDSLIALDGVGISLADALYEQGFFSANEVSKCTIDELLVVRGITQEQAEQIIASAQASVEAALKASEELEAADTPENGAAGETSEKNGDDVPADADEEVPAEQDDNVPADADEEMPAEQDDDAPADEDEEVPAEQDDDAPADEDEEMPAEQDDDAPADAGGEMPAELDDDVPADEDEEVPAEQDEEAPADREDADENGESTETP